MSESVVEVFHPLSNNILKLSTQIHVAKLAFLILVIAQVRSIYEIVHSAEEMKSMWRWMGLIKNELRRE